jgi:hypothetical protein
MDVSSRNEVLGSEFSAENGWPPGNLGDWAKETYQRA